MNSDLTFCLTVRFTTLDITNVKYCCVDGWGLSFTVTDKICDTEGSILHASSFYRAVKVEHPPKKEGSQAGLHCKTPHSLRNGNLGVVSIECYSRR